jgi:hypothetical protein
LLITIQPNFRFTFFPVVNLQKIKENEI